jgi:RNA polymerase sigma factor (sigma-70 family)
MIALARRCPPYGPLTPSQQELAAGSIRLALYYARSWSQRLPAHADDLEGEALVGLTKAASAWDPDRDGPFALYARGWIRSGLKGYVSRLRPRGWRSGDGSAPRTTTLAADPLDHRCDPVGTALEVADELEPVLERLPSTYAQLLHALYVLGEDPKAVARSTGLSRSTVNRIRRRSLAILRKCHPAMVMGCQERTRRRD